MNIVRCIHTDRTNNSPLESHMKGLNYPPESGIKGAVFPKVGKLKFNTPAIKGDLGNIILWQNNLFNRTVDREIILPIKPHI